MKSRNPIQMEPRIPRKTLYVLPSLFTTASLFFGLLAIFYTFEKTIGQGGDESLKMACWFILTSAVLDALDGKIARLTGTETNFGVYYDSLSDGIVFGVAPAMLMYSHLRIGDHRALGEMACIAFVICGVLRLARYTDQAGTSEHNGFTGLPIPGAAAVVVSAYLTATINEVPWALNYMPFLMIGLALMMVSRLFYVSWKSIDLEEFGGFNLLVWVALILGTGFALGRYKEWFVLILSGGYALSGPICCLWCWMKNRRNKDAGDKDAGDKDAGENDEPAHFEEYHQAG